MLYLNFFPKLEETPLCETWCEANSYPPTMASKGKKMVQLPTPAARAQAYGLVSASWLYAQDFGAMQRKETG